MRLDLKTRIVSRGGWTACALVCAFFVGWIDYITGPELAVSIFYLLPVTLAAWQAGRWSGFFLAVFSAILWFFAEHLLGMKYSAPAIGYWNAGVRFGFFTVTVLLLTNIKALTQSLISQTERLQHEMAERQQAQEALAAGQRVFRLITENASDLIAVLDGNGRRLYSSPAWRSVLGEGAVVDGRDFLLEVVPEDWPVVQAALASTLDSGKNQRAEYRMALPWPIRPLRYMESEWSLIHEGDPGAGVRNVVVVSRDITLRKRVEELFAREKEVLERIAQGRPLREVITELISKMEHWSEGAYCSIIARDEEDRVVLLECAEHLGFLVGETGAGPKGEVDGESLSARLEGSWARVHEAALGAGLKLVHDQPLLSTLRDPLGWLRIYVREPSDSDADRLRVYEKIAHVAAIALERQRSEEILRRLSSMILNAQEAERLRLARELHDSVSQMLASIGFRLESVLAQVPLGDQALRQELVKVRFLLRKTAHEVRSISENLRPSELDELGLCPAVRDLCEDFKERSQLNLELRLPTETERFSREMELALYRIIQEGLNNVEKHAEATRVALSLQSDNDFVTLTIRDDGKGLKASAEERPHRRPGMGLIDMRERCASLGGSFGIRSDRELGTEIAARIPRSRALPNPVL